MAAFGFIWGMLVLGAVQVASTNYETIKTLAADQQTFLIILGIAGFVVLSFLIIIVMVLSGLLQLLAGRRMPQRWMTIIGFFIGSVAATMVLSQAQITL